MHEEKVGHTIYGRLCRSVGRGRRVRVRSQDGMEKVDDAKQAKKQVEKQRHELEKELRKGQKSD